MKKWFVLAVVFVLFQVNAQAENLDSYINYTGVQAGQAADTRLGSDPGFQFGFLGGHNTAARVIERAFQFTVDQPLLIRRITIDAIAIPNGFNYPQPNDPKGPPQHIEVFFRLYDGTNYHDNGNFPIPAQAGTLAYDSETGNSYLQGDEHLVVSSKFDFKTKNSVDERKFNNVKLPFEAELLPGNTYWISAESPGRTGVKLDYTTSFQGKVITPEPSTMLLLGGGLAGAIWRRRKVTKA